MIDFHTATLEDLDLLVATRMKVIRAVFGPPEGEGMKALEVNTRAYYRAALAEDRHCAVLALDGDTVAGCGDICFFTIMPIPPSPGGRQAYVMNMYTDPAYRRQGIATAVLDRLVRAARVRGVTQVKLDASQLGLPLYARYGFRPAGSEMVLMLG